MNWIMNCGVIDGGVLVGWSGDCEWELGGGFREGGFDGGCECCL